ncbi:MAG TPA: enoyl-CoA hydratase-related protein [Burkholderiales bacterium]|nr:enoyl-CoA hydratase-related protein [Burkholderiales bacterium]
MANEVGKGTVLWDLDARGVATVTLNRPKVNNAYNGDMIAGLHEAMDTLGAKPGLRVVVMRGNGRHFQAGADLEWISAVGRGSADENERASRATAEAVRRLGALPVPTVALVQGGCFGGGTGIVSVCDIVVAADNAVFAITEARWGLMAGIILPQLCQAIGVRNVRRYALTCERFGPDVALRIGFVHEVCKADELDAVGARIVDGLLMNAPGATTSTKLRTLQVAGSFIDDGLFRDLVHEHAVTRMSAEAAEGTASFLEKRPPKWYPGKA